jgi:hypothetical protein
LSLCFAAVYVAHTQRLLEAASKEDFKRWVLLQLLQLLFQKLGLQAPVRAF